MVDLLFSLQSYFMKTAAYDLLFSLIVLLIKSVDFFSI